MIRMILCSLRVRSHSILALWWSKIVRNKKKNNFNLLKIIKQRLTEMSRGRINWLPWIRSKLGSLVWIISVPAASPKQHCHSNPQTWNTIYVEYLLLSNPIWCETRQRVHFVRSRWKPKRCVIHSRLRLTVITVVWLVGRLRVALIVALEMEGNRETRVRVE